MASRLDELEVRLRLGEVPAPEDARWLLEVAQAARRFVQAPSARESGPALERLQDLLLAPPRR